MSSGINNNYDDYELVDDNDNIYKPTTSFP